MIALSVNVNKIALLRNSRDTAIPDVMAFARICLDEGAEGITVHPRPDQRHIRADDCRRLASVFDDIRQSRSAENAPFPLFEFNIEGNPFAGARPSERDGVSAYPGFMELIRELTPEQCTLVPDGDDQLTSDHGFDLERDGDRLSPILAELRQLGVRSSLFMDPNPHQMQLAKDIGADRIELYTESYAKAFETGHNVDDVFERFADSAEAAVAAGLGVNAGHDLNLANLPRFSSIPGLMEVSIGHALTVDALHMGMSAAVRAYRAALAS
ncbi:MAG: pyridoxine 5'-phosphate synthase [Pseudomonadota bacterium]